MLKRIHVNQQTLKKSRQHGEREAPLSIECGKKVYHAHYVDIRGETELIYSPDKPRHCGATVWMETSASIALRDVDRNIFMELN